MGRQRLCQACLTTHQLLLVVVVVVWQALQTLPVANGLSLLAAGWQGNAGRAGCNPATPSGAAAVGQGHQQRHTRQQTLRARALGDVQGLHGGGVAAEHIGCCLYAPS